MLVDAIERALRDRLRALRRDVTMLKSALVGGGPPPVRVRTRAPAQPGIAPRPMRVVAIVRETADAVSITLQDPAGAPIAFVAGQFLTLVVDVDGESLRRAYSISSSALEPRRVTVTVKRVAGGRVSSYLNEGLRVGDELRVLGPSGAFTAEPAEATRHFLLIGGGSGITPLMAIARTLLASDPLATIALVYANRGVEDIIFHEALASLARAHAERFSLRLVLESPPSEWSGGEGRLDRDGARRELSAFDEAVWSKSTIYVCGPEPMRAAVREVLRERGASDARVREERFASPAARSTHAGDAADEGGALVVRIAGEEKRVLVAAGQTMLEAGIAAGIAMPFSCAMGGCGACMVKLASGDVVMEEPTCLTTEERDDGQILACVARPRGACVIEVP